MSSFRELHPFFHQIVTVDHTQYPSLVLKDVPHQEEPTGLAIDTEAHLFLPIWDGSNLSLNILEQQDYHENYHVNRVAKDDNEVLIDGIVTASPYAIVFDDLDHNTRFLYWTYFIGNTRTWQKYKVTLIENRLEEQWSMNITNQTNSPDYLSHHQDSNYFYYYEYRAASNEVIIFTINKSNGNSTSASVDVPSFSNPVTYFQITYTPDETHIYWTFLTSQGLYVGMTEPGDTTLPAVRKVTDGTLSRPVTIPFNDMVIHNYQRSGVTYNRYLYLAINKVDNSGSALDKTILHHLDRVATYDEVANSPDVSDQHLKITIHPNDHNYWYLGYLTDTLEIRVVKFHRQVTTTVNGFNIVKMWSSKKGAVPTPDTNIQYHLQMDEYDQLHLQLLVDGILTFWRIDEFIMDFGHTYNTMANVDTITNMLRSIPTHYTINGVNGTTFVPNLEDVNNIVIESVTPNDVDGVPGRVITLKYINYDYYILHEDDRQELLDTITGTLETLYSRDNVDLLDLPSLQLNDIGLEGDDEKVIIRIPIHSIVPVPCVVKGTQVIKDKQITLIEKIKVNDLILNQHGRPVKVKRHYVTRVPNQGDRRPYHIPAHFFAKGRPYRSLLISGDHAILLPSGKVKYPYQISGLRQISPVNSLKIEYHHLLLDNDRKNYFIANGLPVDSYHQGAYLI